MSACEPCLRRAALLGRLVPWIERALDERRRVPEVLALVGRGADRRGVRRASARRIDRFMERVRRRRARGATHGAPGSGRCARTSAALPVCAARRSATRPRALYLKGDAGAARAAGARARRSRSSDRASASTYGQRGCAHARARARGDAACRSSAGWRSASTRPRTRARLRGRGPAVAVMPSGADVAYPRSHHGLHRRLCEQGLVVSELPPGTTPVAVVLPRPQPDHGRARAHDGRGRGHRDVGLADHRAVRPGLRPRGRGGAGPGHVRPRRRARTRCSPTARASCARRPTCSTRCTAPASDRHAARRRARAARAAAGAAAARRWRRGSGVDSIVRGGAEVGDVLAGLTELELLGLVRARPRRRLRRAALEAGRAYA